MTTEVTPALERQRLITAAEEELSLLRRALTRLEKEHAGEVILRIQRDGIKEAEQKIRQLKKTPLPAAPEVNPPAVKLGAVPEELPSDHELLFHFGIEEAGSPGAVLNEAIAKLSPCSCFTYKGKDLCWSKGIVGLLTQNQQKVYCVAGKTYKPRPALTERYTRFAEAAEEAHKKIETMPKGMPRLEAWLSAMGEELSKRGIEV